MRHRALVWRVSGRLRKSDSKNLQRRTGSNEGESKPSLPPGEVIEALGVRSPPRMKVAIREYKGTCEREREAGD
jgi:hypothetical protein